MDVADQIRMHEAWRDLGISQHRFEQLSSLWNKVDIRQVRVVPIEHDVAALVLVIKCLKLVCVVDHIDR